MTTEEKISNNPTEDPALLLVSGSKGNKDTDREYVKRLSNALSQVLSKHQVARLRCVGAAAINNAVKAFIIAKENSKENGKILTFDPSFTTVNFQGDEKTGILFEVKII